MKKMTISKTIMVEIDEKYWNEKTRFKAGFSVITFSVEVLKYLQHV